MNATRQINTFSAGMNMDVDYSLLKENQYAYAENIRILTNEGSSMGAMQNIEGFLSCNPSLVIAGETIIHTTTIRDWAIVITNINNTSNFSIYRYDFSASDSESQVTKIVNARPLGLTASSNKVYAISSVCRWESNDNVKLYLSDGQKQIKVINIDDSHISKNSNITEDDITIVPTASLPPFEFRGFGSGGLQSGSIQYCYQLFQKRGLESALSQLTPLFNLNQKDSVSNSREIIGSLQNQNTGKSVKLRVTNSNTKFDRARIISIFYKNRNDAPTISIIDDINIEGTTVIEYEDRGNNYTSELSVDEFNMLTGYSFVPEVIESKDNRLFAANITEDTWDVEYDARAYRANSSGNVLLLSNTNRNITFPISSVATYEVPEDHDCICPYNITGEEYKYIYGSTGQMILGGQGRNVKYRFITTNLVEDESTITNNRLSENFTFNTTPKTRSYLTIHYENNEKTSQLPLSSSSSRIFNYGDSEIAAKVKGYMRDEIYRFGIVLYNDRGLASPVHWIADIRMPSVRDDDFEIFTFNESNEYGNNITLTTKPLGIEFEVDNLPDEVVRYEIVRCDRTLSDRTILAQGLVSCVTNYDYDSSTLTPFPYLSYNSIHGYESRVHNAEYQYIFDLASTQSQNYFIFVSPEVCVNRDNSTELISKFQTVEKLMSLTSPIYNDLTFWTNQELSAVGNKMFANAKAIRNTSNVITSQNTYRYEQNNGLVIDGKLILYSGGDETPYNALLSKYYVGDVDSTVRTANIDSANYSGPSGAFMESGKDWPWHNADGTPISEKTYYNWVWDNIRTADDGEVDETDANNVRKYGPHGICAVFKSDDMINNIPLLTSDTAINGVILCNMKQSIIPYGGNSYSAKQNSVYITTGVNADANTNTVLCFGGDTYINILDYNVCMFAYYTDDYHSNEANKLFSGAFFPVESSVNLMLTSSDSSINRTYEAGSGYANHFVQDDIISVGDIYSQNTPSYSYNDAYSAQPTLKQFVGKSIYDIDNLLTDTRIMASELKTNNEVTDSWTKFKVANYLDVDTRYGSINDMKLFHNYLLFWQTDAFGIAAVNERSLITDNNPGALTLGTGGILDRFDYITTKNGEAPNQLRANTQSDSTVYWFDSKRNEICAYDSQLNTVSKLKGVQSYLNFNKDIFLLDPITVYDKKYNEVLFTLENKTLVFNEQLGAFTSFYTYKPDYYAEFSDKLYLFKNLKLYKYNSGEERDLDNDKAKISYIKFIVNQGYPQTKTFDNVEYGGDFTYGTNFDNIYFETKRQTSFTLTQNDIDYREDTYKFCIPRSSRELNEAEELVNKSYRDRMKGKYLVCHYKYDCNGGNTFKVPYISTAYRNSLI